MRKLVLLAMLAACVPWACAQRMASAPAHFSPPAHPAPPVFHGVRGNFPLAREAGRFFRGPKSQPFGSEFLPLLANWFNPDDLYSAGYPVASPLPYFVMQGGGSAPDSVDRQPQSPHESVLLELHGDRYVRLNGSDVDNGVQQLALSPSQDAHASARKN